jgi:ribonuclease PH
MARGNVAAVSAGYVKGDLLLDLAYAEDSIADADVNVVATGEGELIEVQGTAEGHPFSRGDFDQVLELALEGIAQLIAAQRAALR